MKLYLQAADSPNRPALEFVGSTITIGRDCDCDLAMAETTNVSGRHVQITLTPQGAFLSDLKSTNGTYLNDSRLEGRKKLEKGDYFRLGQTGPCFEVVAFDLTIAAPSRAVGGGASENDSRHETASQHGPGYCIPGKMPSVAKSTLTAAPGHTRFMVLALQESNRKLIIRAGIGSVVVLFIIGVTGLYFFSKVEKLTQNEEDTIYSRFADAVYHVAIYPDDTSLINGTAFAISKDGKLATNGHITNPARQALLAGKKVEVVSHGGKKVYPVIDAVSHPQYDESGETPDVGILTVRLTVGEYLPKVVELASEKDLRKLSPGAQLCYIGFPSWSDYSSLHKIEPHIYKGGLTRLLTLKEESGDFSNQYLLQHSMASTGGASGSPIFNREGKVVAIHNSGDKVNVLAPDIDARGKVTYRIKSIPSGWRAGMRIDLLKDLLRSNK